MAGFPNKVSVPSAIKERNNFPLDCVHQTTSDIGLTQVTYIQPLVPTDKVNISISSFAYLASMLKPTMGACDLVQRAFFVPFDFISADWKSFIANRSTNQDSSTQPKLPSMQFEEVMLLFFDIFSGQMYDTTTFGALNSNDINKWVKAYSDMVTTDIGNKILFFDLYDIYFTFHNNPTPPIEFDYELPGVFFTASQSSLLYDVYFKFKPLGKKFFDLLIQLGYSIELGNVYKNGIQTNAIIPSDCNMLAIFSLLKVYIDYYVDPRYNWADFSTFFREFTSDTNGFDSLDTHDKALLLHDILALCVYCWFGNDLFTSSWQSHEQPALNGLFKSISISVPNNDVNSEIRANTSSSNDVMSLSSLTGSSRVAITDTLLKMLNAVSSYFKRNNIAGTRPIDVAFARFGVHIPEVVSQRAQYIGSHRVPLKIADIMANSAGADGDGNTSVLGERAGQGIIAGKPFNIRFENKYFYGYLIVLSHIVPKTMYYQGIKPWNLNNSLFDFYTPEMEEVGAEPIPNMVLYSDQQNLSDSFNFTRSSIFGYAPRYYQYKFGFDTLSGDFRLKRYYNSLRSYCMFRELTDFYEPDENDLKNDSAFRQFSDKHRAAYDKMFVSQDIQDDHFIINYLISSNANRPMRGIGISLLGKIEGGKKSVGLRPNGKYF